MSDQDLIRKQTRKYNIYECIRCYEEAATGKAVETTVHALRVNGIDGNVPIKPD